jgi:serine/threonine protein kinase
MQHAVDTIPGLVHLDLKPDNLLVGADRLSADRLSANRLRITDFGLARALRMAGTAAGVQTAPGGSHTMHSAGFAGTPEYAAPEQFSGGEIDLRADVYALGCILVEMLTGQMPVRASSSKPEVRLPECAQQHRQGRVLAAAGGLPAAVRPLLGRCLAVNRDGRYRTWAEVEAALAEAYRTVTDRPAPAPEPVAALGRAARVAAGRSYSAMGYSYLDLGQAETALGYFERARAAGPAQICADQPQRLRRVEQEV